MIVFAGQVFALFLIGVIAVWFVVARRRAPDGYISAIPNHAAVVLYGAQLLADDIRFFKDWSSAMLREFDGIETHLQVYFALSERLLQQDRSSWPGEAAELVASNDKLAAMSAD